MTLGHDDSTINIVMAIIIIIIILWVKLLEMFLTLMSLKYALSVG